MAKTTKKAAPKKAAPKAPKAAPAVAAPKPHAGVINGVKVYREGSEFKAEVKGKTVSARTYMGIRVVIRKASKGR